MKSTDSIKRNRGPMWIVTRREERDRAEREEAKGRTRDIQKEKEEQRRRTRRRSSRATSATGPDKMQTNKDGQCVRWLLDDSYEREINHVYTS